VKPGAVFLLALLTVPAPARAQGAVGQLGRFYDGGGWNLYRLGFTGSLWGPLGFGLHGEYLRRAGDGDGGFAGLGADINLFRGGGQGPYVVAGLGGGLGSASSSRLDQWWGSWSAGVGYELLPTSFLSVGAEARWRELSPGSRDGFELAAGLGLRFGGRGSPPPARSTPAVATADSISRPSPSPGPPDAPASSAALTDSIIATASEAMGRRYQLGGTGIEGQGFDCSGLIQYAYGRHGITLPRRSGDQARSGQAISRQVERLQPGDLLTFSNGGGVVTHVGMYLGERRFIHSATRGVQVSLLSDEDPYGRWWHQRWVGVRRIVGE